MPSASKRPRPSSRRPPRSQRPRLTPSSDPQNFAQLVGAASSLADVTLGEDAPDDTWAAISLTVGNLASQPAVSQPPLSTDLLDYPSVDHVTDGDGVVHDEQANGCTLFPCDLAIKTKLTVLSTRDLWWTNVRGQGEEYLALCAFLGSSHQGNAVGSEARDTPTPAVLRARRKFYTSLLHFRHPYAPLPASISTRWQALFSNPTVTRLNELREVGNMRLQQWQDAFRSLYYGYKYGHVDAFYVILATTTVLFSRVSTRNKSPRVVFARATPGLRALLSEFLVTFRIEGAASDDPCVIVDDAISVHATYNFIFAAGAKVSNATDVPILLCDSPFRGACAVSATVSKARHAKLAGDDTRQTFSVHITGLLLPRQVRGLCEAFAEAQGEFSARLETEKSASRLNICGHGDDELEIGTSNGAGVDGQPRVLKGSVVLSKVTKRSEDGDFIIATRDVG